MCVCVCVRDGERVWLARLLHNHSGSCRVRGGLPVSECVCVYVGVCVCASSVCVCVCVCVCGVCV